MRIDRARTVGFAVTMALHAAVAYLIVTHRPALPAVQEPVPLMVSFVDVARAPQPLPQPKPQPQEKPTVRMPRNVPPPRQEVRKPEPVIAAAAQEAPAPQETPRTVEAPPAPAAIPSAAPAAAPVRIADVPTPVRVAPSFNADYLQNPAPRYPSIARRLGQQGKVVLRVLVSQAGAPAQVEVRTSSGSDVLDEAALDAVKRWRFVPAREGTRPVSAWVLVPITFTLQG